MSQNHTEEKHKRKVNAASMGIVAVLSAIAYILMFMEFSVPIMPGFYTGAEKPEKAPASERCWGLP